MLTEKQRAEKVAKCQGEHKLSNRWKKVSNIQGFVAVKPKSVEYHEPGGYGRVKFDLRNDDGRLFEFSGSCKVTCDENGNLQVELRFGIYDDEKPDLVFKVCD